jgi:hypothetical protein
MKTWTPTGEPLTFNRLWLWTMGAEKANQQKAVTTTKNLGCTDLCVLINNPPSQQPNFGVNPSLEALIEFTRLGQSHGLSVHWSTWIDPKPAYVQAAAELIAPMKEHKVSSLCLDLEGEWRKRTTSHIDFVSDHLAPAFAGCKTPIGVSSFAALPKEVEPALAWAVKMHRGYGAPQSYSVWQGKAWQQAASVQPDKLPQVAQQKWSPLCGDRIQMILAAYGQTAPGRYFGADGWGGPAWGVAEALSASLERCQWDGIKEVGFWSEEALSLQNSAAKERAQVIESIKVKGRSMVAPRAIWPYVAAGIGGVALLTRRSWLPLLRGQS